MLEGVIIYSKELGLDGTIPELVRQANRYTQDFSNEALQKISDIAKTCQMDDKYVAIPLLLIDERNREESDEDGNSVPYERMKIDYLYDGYNISFAYSNYCQPGTELEIRQEEDKVLVAMYGIDENGTWSAASACSMNEFMKGDTKFLDNFINEVLACCKEYDEER